MLKMLLTKQTSSRTRHKPEDSAGQVAQQPTHRYAVCECVCVPGGQSKFVFNQLYLTRCVETHYALSQVETASGKIPSRVAVVTCNMQVQPMAAAFARLVFPLGRRSCLC